MPKRKIGWVDGKDNIAVVRYNKNEEIVPIEGDALAKSLNINGSLYVLSPIKGNLDIREAKIGNSVSVENADVYGWLYAKKAEIGGSLYVEKARINNIDVELAKIGQSLNVEDTEIEDSLNAFKAEINGSLIVREAKIGHLLDAIGANIGEDLNVEKSEIGNLNIRKEKIGKRLAVEETKIDGTWFAGGAEIGEYLYANEARIGGGIDIRGGKIKRFDLINTEISKGLNMKNAEIDKLVIEDAKFKEINLEGSVIREFDGMMQSNFQYKINEYTKLSESLRDQLPHYE